MLMPDLHKFQFVATRPTSSLGVGLTSSAKTPFARAAIRLRDDRNPRGRNAPERGRAKKDYVDFELARRSHRACRSLRLFGSPRKAQSAASLGGSSGGSAQPVAKAARVPPLPASLRGAVLQISDNTI